MSAFEKLVDELRELGAFVTRHQPTRIWPPEYKFTPPPEGEEEKWHT